MILLLSLLPFFFFFNDTATTEIYTLSLHDALPISVLLVASMFEVSRLAFIGLELNALAAATLIGGLAAVCAYVLALIADRKSTRLNSSHPSISYAVFCLKKKKIESVIRTLSSK